MQASWLREGCSRLPGRALPSQQLLLVSLRPYTRPDPSLSAPPSPHRTCVWQPLPEGWKEAHDPITNQPYYYNPATGAKTWARPMPNSATPASVTATRVMSMEQPQHLQPGGSKRRAMFASSPSSGSGGMLAGASGEGSAATAAVMAP